ncbi:hypothetical protein ACFSL6_08495 [Paenibacillus thailandensis]|uniref:Uncharacterized protein n=1 Tax=Paenibacillus thailandensis TaxID=393250 RepID=A0ABW5QYR2_9BACL
MPSNKGTGGLSSDDLAIIAGIVVVIGDILALWALIKAKQEDEEVPAAAVAAVRGVRESNRKPKGART